MDILTHALASATAARVLVPRAALPIWIAAIAAGIAADVDQLTALAGPNVYLTWHHTYTHSIAAAIAIATVATIVHTATRKNPAALSNESLATPKTAQPETILQTFLALQLIALLHLVLDICQSDPITPLWPFTQRRIAANYLPTIDPYIIAILLAALLLPELLRLVSNEISSKAKSPRGRTGAAIGLAVILLYSATRAALHSNAADAIDSRTYRNESPRRSAAYPDSTSLSTWHAIVETESALHEFTLNATQGSAFDPQDTTVLYKPESSPVLETARNSPIAKQFLTIAQFPKATIEKTPEGFEIQLRDLRDAATGNTSHAVSALIQTDATGKILEDELVWTHAERNNSHQN
jgi:membrane-bound metal-dependent hydrolase YbcI (DUF457 family)